jgi:hypothetical protein
MNRKKLQKIKKYLKGELPQKERMRLEYFLDSIAPKADFDEDKASEVNEDLIGERIFTRIEEAINLHESNKEINYKHKQKTYSRMLIFEAGISAALFLIFLLSIPYFRILETNITEAKYSTIPRDNYDSTSFVCSPSPSEWKIKKTNFGQKDKITLPDGSQVILNSDSKIRYRDNFAGNTREVYLEGEAFFNIAHDSNRVFVVHTKNISTYAIGTSFNIKSFPEEKEIIVSLVTGKVKVTNIYSTSDGSLLFLQPQIEMVYQKEKQSIIIRPFKINETLSWKGNILRVVDEPLGMVIIKLERFYGIKFELTNNSNSDTKITANFNRESYQSAIELIQKKTGLEYYKLRTESDEIVHIIFM